MTNSTLRTTFFRAHVFATLTLAVAAALLCSTAHAQPRQTELFNFGWVYLPGRVAKDPAKVSRESHFQVHVDESRWTPVQLPHDAAIGGAFQPKKSTAANGFRPHGVGWYRKHFTVDETARGQNLSIQFEGVYRDARVWINGTYLSRHPNGYLGFAIDLTPHLNYGGSNVIAVQYDNSTQMTSRWYTGEGIYRDVYLVTTDKVHVPQHGTYITTPKIGADRAMARVQTEVVNDRGERTTVKLVTEILGADGAAVARSVSVAPLSPGENFRFTQEIDVDAPALWSCGDPHLYTAASSVYADGVLVDDYETTFGVREIRMTPDKGMTLNGEKIIAKGGNLHHDLGPLGSAALRAGYERRLRRLKAMGCNSIRLSHNPHAPVLLDLADRMGFLVFNEAYDKLVSQFYGGTRAFEDVWPQDLTTFIRRDRNHPSVYIWSVGNEVYKQHGWHDPLFETPADGADYGVDLFKRMKALTHALDPSRKVTIALYPAREKFVKEWEHWDDYDTFANANPAEMAFYSDVVSWNYTENMFAADQKRFPQMAFIASETGTNLGFGTRKNSWLECDLDTVVGHYFWTAADYLGEAGKYPQKVWGRSFLDITDEMTATGHLYQQFYSDEPMVRVMVMDRGGPAKERFDGLKNKRWDWYPVTESWTWDEGDVTVQVMSNADEVELFLNGESLGTKRYTEKYQDHLAWDVAYADGELKAVARSNGERVAEHVLKTAGEPVAIRLAPDVDTLRPDGLGLAYVRATLVDDAGTVVPNADRLVRFTVEGGGTNAGVGTGDIFSDEHWNADARTTHHGKSLMIVRSNRKQQDVTVTATAQGLPDQTVVIPVRLAGPD